MGQRYVTAAAVERVLAIDPTRIWSLLGDPLRLAEWAGVRLVGYMGTELPRPKQSVFVRRRSLRRRTVRVEIDSWSAGERFSCLVHVAPQPVRFELVIRPEIGTDKIGTRIRMTQQASVPMFLANPARWWLRRQLEARLKRIAKAARL